MTLSEYIKHLQKLADDENLANAKLIVREDDEGNGYRKMPYTPYAVFVEKGSGYYIECVWEDIDDEDSEHFEKVILIN